MYKVLILVCSLQPCTDNNARIVMTAPTTEITSVMQCFAFAQEYLAQTALVALEDKEYLRVVCTPKSQ